jgi:capsular polysaccharide biosynthesis protein/Mrp family chromosome partitioning ATPase
VEPIDYKRGIRRRLPLILVLIIIGGVVGAVVSIHSKNANPYFTATAVVTVAPKGTTTSGISVQEVEYYAEQQPVFDATGRAINNKHPNLLRQYIHVGGGGVKKAKKGSALPPGEITIAAQQPKRNEAVDLANAFAKALLNYANQQVADQHNLAISEANAELESLSTQIELVNGQIAALNKKPAKNPATAGKTGKTTTTTTTPSNTTSTTKPKGGAGDSGQYVPAVSNDAVAQACDAIVNQGLQCAPATDFVYETSSVPTSLVITTQPPVGTWVPDNGQVNLVISIGPKTTTTTQHTTTTTTASTTTSTTLNTGTPTTPVTNAAGFGLTGFVRTAASSTTTPAPTTTTPAGSKNSLPYLQAELKGLDSQYTAAFEHLQSLHDGGVPTAGLTFIQPARGSATKASKPVSVSPFAHKSIRIGTGLAIGLILGVLIALLWDGLDKRIRKADRAAVVFGLPVLVEVPKATNRASQAAKTRRSGSKGKRRSGKGPTFVPEVASPYVALVDAPASLIAEAYRRLRVAIMFTPAATVSTEGPKEPEYGWGASGNGSGANGNNSNDGHHAEGPADGERRQVIMVVSTGFEPTRSEVVANLAAAYAEAGQRALVVTTTDVRAGRLAPAPWTAPARTDQRVTAPMSSAAFPVSEVPSTRIPSTAPTGLPGLPGSVPTPPLPPGVAPPGSFTGEPTARVDVGRSSAGPPPEASRPITVEEVAANCVGQQIAGVARLQLGSVLRGPGEMAIRGTEVLNVARHLADVILVEVPALLATPDAEALARGVDAVVVVAECYFTKVGPAGRASSVLSRMGAPLLGLAVTQVEVPRKEQRKIKQNLALPARDSQRQVPAHMVS